MSLKAYTDAQKAVIEAALDERAPSKALKKALNAYLTAGNYALRDGGKRTPTPRPRMMGFRAPPT